MALQTAHPQPWNTKGFSVGGHVSVAAADAGTTHVDGQPTDPDRVTGVGGGLFLGYGVTDWLTIYLNGDGREKPSHRRRSSAAKREVSGDLR